MTLDAFKLKHGGPGAGFLLRWAAQIIFEPGMTGSHDRKTRAAPTRFFDQLFETAERLAMHIMAIIDKEDNRLLASAHHFHSGSFALFRCARQVPIFVRGQVVIQRQFERIERDAWYVKGQRFGHLDLAFLPPLPVFSANTPPVHARGRARKSSPEAGLRAGEGVRSAR